MLEEIVTTESVLGGEMKRLVASRHFHDEIQRPARLRAVHQCRSAANQLDPLDRIENRRVMRFRKSELLVLDGDAVFQYLHGLAALRIETAISEIHDG